MSINSIISYVCVYRHPLYSMSTEGLVNNNLNIPDKEHRVSLITGPNASGKTTFITQVNGNTSIIYY
jgi:DNA mismatch repair ATPase MutS